LPVAVDIIVALHDNPGEEPNTKRRLLICEDDEDQSAYLKLLLESAGFLVEVASTVAKARQFLAEHLYQAILLDLILPDQDGITFIRNLRSEERTKDLHIIVISVITQTGQALLNGDAVLVADWFDKPIDFNKLLTSINHIKSKKSVSPLPQILHIEDNKDMQLVVETLLEAHAVVSAAGSLHEARSLLEKNNYDLIILDLMLPDGNGLDILPLLAQYRSPVLVFSDMKFNEDYAQYVSNALMKSSSSNEMLLNTIKHLL